MIKIKKNVDKQKKNRKKIMEDDLNDLAAPGRKFLDDSDDESAKEESINPDEVRRDLSLYANDIRSRLDLDDNLVDKLSKEEKRVLDESSKDILNWLDKNKDASEKDLVKKNKEFKDKVNPIINRADALNELEKYTNDLKKRLQDDDDDINKLSKKDLKRIQDSIDQLEDWMDKNPNATADEINAEKERQRGIIDPILSKAKKRADLEDYVNDMRKRSQDDSLGEMFSDKEKKNYWWWNRKIIRMVSR